MEIESYFRINKNFTESEQLAIAEIETRFVNLLTIINGTDCLTQVLGVMHHALTIDQHKFIKDIFLKFKAIQDLTHPHREKLFCDFEIIKDKRSGSIEEQTHLVNIYRSLISDLFDPYISLLVSCFQLIEGNFTDFQTANLSNSERGKHEYVVKRLNGTKIFEGYDPLVRNAISHAGSNGIRYEQEYILFKNIKRGKPPIVTWVKWTTDELMWKIVQLFSFVYGLDCAINIFGIDISPIIFGDIELERSFMWQVLDKGDRKAIGDEQNKLFERISKDNNQGESEKLKNLTDLFFYQCAVRNMPVSTFGYSAKMKAVRFQVPKKLIDISNQKDLQARFFELFRYGILAEPIYRFFADRFVITEISSDSEDLLKVICSSSDMKKYGEEEAGLIDLIHDSRCFVGKDRVEVVIDWNSVTNSEYESVDEIFPRKKRKLN